MITIGVDAHKRVHVALALDQAGRDLSEWRGPNSELGWRRFEQWASALGAERQVGIEGAWGYGRGLAQHLVAAGEVVHEVNPRWTADGRRSARKPDKTDRQDARAVALFVQREASNLPPISAEDETALLDLLATEREAAVVESTRLRNRLHALLSQLDPEYHLHMPAMGTKAGRAALRVYEASDDRPISLERAASVRRLAERLDLVVSQAEAIARRIRELAKPRFVPLTELHGVSLLTAGTIAGILGPGRRFSSDAALAAFAAACPLEASSAGHVRHRLNRGGNRRLNAILYRIALTQAHSSPLGRAYIARRRLEGKSWREAVRALKRHLVRALWRLWKRCRSAPDRISELAAAQSA